MHFIDPRNSITFIPNNCNVLKTLQNKKACLPHNMFFVDLILEALEGP